jgi:sec-independent protein translocase protein TatC
MVILIASAILTPTPDIVTQLLLAGPIYVLYEASIVIAYVVGRKRATTSL